MNWPPRHPFLRPAIAAGHIFSSLRNATATLALVLAACGATVQGGEIHEAAELGNLAKIKECLARDPKQINTADAKGRTVLTRAGLSAKKEVVDFLLQQGAAEDIFAAAIVGHTNKVASLLKQDAKLAITRDSCGKTALHWAALYGQRPVAALLLSGKADVNATDEVGFTPLHWAVMFDKSDVAELLVTNKASLSIKVDKFGWTPLRLAVIHGHLATARVLLKNGADPNLPDEGNIPLLHQAIISGRKEIVGLLLANKVDINKKDPEGETPMAEALEQGNKEMIDFLRRHGAKEK